MDDRVESKQGDMNIGSGQSLLEGEPGRFAVGHRQPSNFRHLSNLNLPRNYTIAVSMLLRSADTISTFGPMGIRKQKAGEKRLSERAYSPESTSAFLPFPLLLGGVWRMSL